LKRPLYKSFSCAFSGLWVAIKTERNFKIHLAAMMVAVGLGIYLGLSAASWCLVVFAIGFVLAAELLNTSIERLCDEVSAGKNSEPIRHCKDMSAAGVLIAAITALIIGIIVLIVPFIQRLID
jgi:diacylglycerol kinase (ATP)